MAAPVKQPRAMNAAPSPAQNYSAISNAISPATNYVHMPERAVGTNYTNLDGISAPSGSAGSVSSVTKNNNNSSNNNNNSSDYGNVLPNGFASAIATATPPRRPVPQLVRVIIILPSTLIVCRAYVCSRWTYALCVIYIYIYQGANDANYGQVAFASNVHSEYTEFSKQDETDYRFACYD